MAETWPSMPHGQTRTQPILPWPDTLLTHSMMSTAFSHRGFGPLLWPCTPFLPACRRRCTSPRSGPAHLHTLATTAPLCAAPSELTGLLSVLRSSPDLDLPIMSIKVNAQENKVYLHLQTDHTQCWKGARWQS